MTSPRIVPPPLGRSRDAKILVDAAAWTAAMPDGAPRAKLRRARAGALQPIPGPGLVDHHLVIAADRPIGSTVTQPYFSAALRLGSVAPTRSASRAQKCPHLPRQARYTRFRAWPSRPRRSRPTARMPRSRMGRSPPRPPTSRPRPTSRPKPTLNLLELQGIAVPEEARLRILGCSDRERLDTWLCRSVGAKSLADVFAD